MADATHLQAAKRPGARDYAPTIRPSGQRTHASARVEHHDDPVVHDAVEAFLDRYDNARTAYVYSIHMRVFLDWCTAAERHPFEVRRRDLEAFMRYLTRERGNRPSSVAARMTVIRYWYDLLVDDELVDRNPGRMLRLPSHHPDPENLIGLSLMEYVRVEEAARERGPERWALVVLMARLGLRVSEACAVDVEDWYDRVQQGHDVLTLVGKGGKPATLPLTVPVLRALDAARDGRTSGPLIRTRSGARLDRRGALRWMTTLGRDAGVERISCHALRRTYITLSLAAGADVREVQRGARHAKLDTTMRYEVARNVLDRHVNHVLSAHLSTAV